MAWPLVEELFFCGFPYYRKALSLLLIAELLSNSPTPLFSNGWFFPIVSCNSWLIALTRDRSAINSDL